MELQSLASAVAVLCLFGCGSRSGLPLPSGEPSTEIDEPLACIADLPRSNQPWTRGRACNPAFPSEFGLFAVVDFDLVGVRGGSASVVTGFFEGESDEASSLDAFVAVAGDWVAASVARLPFGADYGDPFEARTVLARRDGTVILRLADQGEWNGGGGTERVLVSDRGVLAVGATFDDEARTTVARDLGVLSAVQGVLPIAIPGPNGWIATREVDPLSSDHETLWLNPCTGELVPSAESARAVQWRALPWHHRLVYPGDPAQDRLMIESEPGSVETIAMGERADLIEIHPAGWALLATDVDGRVIVVDLEQGTSRRITIDLPPGTKALGSGSETRAYGARVTSDGRLYLPLRDSALGFVYVSADGATWKTVGLPIGQVYGARVREADGTFYVYGDANAVTLPAWDAPPAGVTRLDHASAQVAREDGTVHVLFDLDFGHNKLDDHRLSHDGGCTSDEVGEALEILRVSTGTLENVVVADPESFDPVGASSFAYAPDVLPSF